MAERVIWKFEMPSKEATIDMPAGAYILAVGQQHGALVFWAQCEPDETRRFPRRFRTVATGEPYPAGLDHHGTVQFPNGLVWHLLEEEIP